MRSLKSMWLTVEQPRKRGRYAEKSWRTRLDSKENRKHMFMFCLVVWSIVIFAEYPKFTQAGRPVYVIENVRESSSVTPLDGTRGEEHDGRVEALPTAKDFGSTEGETGAHVATSSPSSESIAEKIRKAWKGTGEERIAVAVAKAESGLNATAKGWNCKYINAQGKEYSDACKPEDRHKAWSVDCGVMQINIVGKECPAHLHDADENIRIGKSMYDTRGFSPWSVWKNKTYLKFL